MRRLANLKTQSGTNIFQNNQYDYDRVGNILKVANSVSVGAYALGGASLYSYSYDELNRLVTAEGTYTGDQSQASYTLNMQYNKLNGIVRKALTHKQNKQDKSYTLDYTYSDPKHPHALSILKDTTTPKPRTYEYDGNGNPISYEGFKDFRVMVWDEENRLQGLNDNGKLHLYTYDHTGERAVKSSAESQKTVINGVSSAVIVHAENYTAYVNPYFVVNKGKFTKHYFEGTSRIVSKLGEGTFHQPTGLTAGGIDYIKQSAKVQEAIDQYIKGLNIPPGPPTQHGIYGTPGFTGVEYPSIDWSDISQDQEPPEGWPRPPKFNEPGDVPGPPVQYGDPVKPDNVKGGFGYVDNGIEEKNLYFYHPDHLGSSSYITDANGDINQHTEYMAFGEVLFDEHNVSRRMPYLFNGKELDSETGLYYYGARYYDPRVSIFLNVDPLVEKTMQPYAYTNNNPIMLIDPTGMEAEDCPTCPKPLYEGQEIKGSDGKLYGAARQQGDIHWDVPTKPLEWLPQTNIEEVTLTGKAKSSFTSTDTSLSNYNFPVSSLPNGKVEMMSGMLDIVGMLLANSELGNKYMVGVAGVAAIALTKGKATDDVLKAESNLWKVGKYSELRGTQVGLQAHHVGQSALMKKMVKGYNHNSAPSILVPEIGHVFKGPFGRISTSTKGLTTPRQVLARDIFELRRVYGPQGIPNTSLQKLIQMNKTMYPSSFSK
ncbi:hypothetical protein PG593_08645 [Riemerella anatipestifer]|nr:hypothetical protein [Riemerella anatipestifer]